MTTSNTKLPVKVYWQPGCSSCLKTKEFLLANGVEFESINVLEDEKGFKERSHDFKGAQAIPKLADLEYKNLRAGVRKGPLGPVHQR